MKRMLTAIVAGMLAMGAMATVWAADKAEKSEKAAEKAEAKKPSGPLDFTMKDIDGKEVDLSKNKGKVVLYVNVASKCGLTPQYKGLQELHKKYSGKGLVIIGFPANNFGGQEPGSNEEIKEFCTSKYDVEFKIMSKVSVKGEDQCGLYKYLTSKESNPKHAGDITWNFEKFMIGRDGAISNRFKPKTKPEEMIKAIEEELAKK